MAEVEVMMRVERRRIWSDAERVAPLAELDVPGSSVPIVARRHGADGPADIIDRPFAGEPRQSPRRPPVRATVESISVSSRHYSVRPNLSLCVTVVFSLLI